MGTYLKLDTNDATIRAEILGYTADDAARVKAIRDEYEPILVDQMREDWHEQYQAQEAALNATPALEVASMYEMFGFGNIRGYQMVKHITKNACGECTGELAVRVLEAQRDDHYLQSVALHAAIQRAIDAVKTGRVKGVYWF